MVVISFALLLVMLVAGLVTAFVAYPHRGQEIPHAHWLTSAMVRASERIRATVDR